ncbi:MAG: DUF262 domain-containing protein [Desulfatiglandales bacterium]
MNRDIVTHEMKITAFARMLAEDKFMIPTFQRDFVWEPEDIIRLWDSIYRFYPIGSILYWETNIDLRIHRKLGGFVLPNGEDTLRRFKKWVYILDGQQRATSLLVSLFGGQGKVKESKSFDYTLYFDATNATFFFAEAFNRRKRDVHPAFLIRLQDMIQWGSDCYESIACEPGFDRTIRNNLRRFNHVLTNYKVPMISLKGFDIPAVCDIFERINQEGKGLKSIDIMIARTFVNDACIVEEDF